MSAAPELDNLLDLASLLEGDGQAEPSVTMLLGDVVRAVVPDMQAARLYRTTEATAFLQAATSTGSDLLLDEAPLYREALTAPNPVHRNGTWVTALRLNGAALGLLEVSVDPDGAEPDRLPDRLRLAAHLLAPALQETARSDRVSLASDYSSDDALTLVQAQYKTSGTIFGSDNPAEVLSGMSDFIDRRFANALLGLIDNPDTPTELHVLAEAGPDGVRRVDRMASLSDYPAHEGLAALEALAVEDVEKDAFLTDAERSRLQEQGIQALVVIPLVIGQRLIGVIAFTHTGPVALSPARLRALRNLADQMAVVFDNQRLLRNAQEATESLSRQVRVLETLNQLAVSAATAEDEKTLFDQAIEGMVKALDIHHGSFTLFNETNEFANIVSEYPLTGAIGLQLDMRNNALFDALFEVIGRPVVVQNVETDTRVTPAALDIFHMLGIKGLMIVPLVVRGEMIGSIGLDKYDADHRFTDNMLEIVETIGAQVSTGLQSIRLLRDTRRQAMREATVNAISTRLQASNNVQGVLTEAARSLQRSLQVGRVAIRLGTPPDLKQPPVVENGNGTR